MKEGKAATAHGEIAYVESEGTGPVVLFIHGNSSSKEIFAKQLSSPIGGTYRCIAMDLPGHGKSANAPEPEKTYSIHGYADAAMALLDALGIGKAVVIGWSLGGHAALEMMARWPGTQAAWITGTPPAGGADMGEAFLAGEHMDLTFKEKFTPDECALYAAETLGPGSPAESWMVEGVARTDGRFRPLMMQSVIAGLDLDGKEIAETSPLPLAVVTGELEPFVNNAFLEKVKYRNLWDGKVHVIKGHGHMPFWQAADEINPLLTRFLKDVC